MRNLAQWVGWVCTDFAACQDEESLLTAARRLKENTPLAQERVHRLRTALSQKSGSDNPRVVELQLVVRKAAHLAGIDVELSGTAQAWIARGLLARVLDNLFSNLSPNWREIDAVKPVCRLRMIAAAQGRPLRPSSCRRPRPLRCPIRRRYAPDAPASERPPWPSPGRGAP